MLQKLNERIQGIIAWVIIILIAVTFALFGVDYYMQQSRRDSTSQVDVNDQPITRQAFELNYQRIRRVRDSARMTVAGEKQLKKQLLDEMIVNEVSLQSARKNGFEVGPLEADAAIVGIPQFQEDGRFSSDRYQQALSSAFFTPESFQKEVRQGMLLNQLRYAFMGTAFALPAEIEQFVALYMQTRDYDYMIIPAKDFLQEAVISDQAMEAYYRSHQAMFMTKEAVILDYIHLSLDETKKRMHIPEQDIVRYYNENYVTTATSSTSVKPFAEVKEAIRQQLVSDAAQTDYMRALEQLSDLSYQMPDTLAPIAKALQVEIKRSMPIYRTGNDSELQKNKMLVNAAFSHDILDLGNNSEPLQFGNDGVIVVRVHKHIPSVVKPFASVKQEIFALLAKDYAKTQAKLLGESLLAKQIVATPDKQSNTKHWKWHSIEKATRDSDAAPVLINELAFTLTKTVTFSGQSTDNGDFIIVRLKQMNDGNMLALDKEQLASITQQIEATYGVVDYDLYLNTLMKKAVVKKY